MPEYPAIYSPVANVSLDTDAACTPTAQHAATKTHATIAAALVLLA
jgi:hypothetical protein